MIMQGAFFKLTGILPDDVYIKELKAGIHKMYGKKGEKVVKMNEDAVDQGIHAIHKVDIPKEWKELNTEVKQEVEEPEFIRKIMRPMEGLKGGDLPVSAFKGREDGTFPSGTTAYEKRGIAVNVPEWIIERCIQCNQCSYVCPHAVIRPFLLDEEEAAKAPESFVTKPASGKNLEGINIRFRSALWIVPAAVTVQMFVRPKGKH
jgi:pyruvate-ferredoxin/flavodoxin oxidoreductase